nr:glycosyltransferase family 4 protein [Holdemania filiformis]
MTSANVDLLSKGQEYVVKAINLLKQKGIRITYFLAGSGDQKYLLEIAKKYGVDDCLVFLGKLTLEEIFERIDNNIDIYIQPSLQEGLPRAVIEAMSRACPCLGARTAGIPELLDDDCIFKPKSAIDIAETIQKVCKNGLTEYAIRNFNKSKEFVEEVLNVRRNRYFNMIKAEIKE